MRSTNQHNSANPANRPAVIHCLWMDAGVVDYKLCDRDYNCEQCPFDEVLHGSPAKELRVISRQKTDIASTRVNGCEIATDLFYHSGHVWSRVEEGGRVRLGLDDFGQRLLGPAYSLSLLKPQMQIKRGDACCCFTHQAGIAALSSPVSGTVTETNANLTAQPSLVNRDPYGQGWLMLVEPADLKGCLRQSLYGERVTPWLMQDIEKLQLIVGAEVNKDSSTPTLMDGGTLSKQFLHGLSVEQIRRVISSFFPLSTEEAEPKSAILISNRR